MDRTLSVSVAGGPPLVRRGLALQLRCRGVVVAQEATDLRAVDPRTARDGLVLLADPRADPQALDTVLGRGVDVVALHDGMHRNAPPPTVRLRLRPAPGATPGARDGARRGRLVVLALHDLAGIEPVLEHLAGGRGPLRPAPGRLTPTERAVHALLGQGYSNAGIARSLSLSPKTVEGCVSTLFGKLGLLRDDPARNRRVAAALSWVDEAC